MPQREFTAADDMANPKAGRVLAYLMGFDGVTWDRLLAAGGALRVAAGVLSAADQINATSVLTVDNAGVSRPLVTLPYLYSGALLDRARNNTDLSILASLARVANTNGPDQVNYNGRGVLVLLNVTANPGGAETLSLKVQGKESIAGGYYDLADAGVVLTAANGLKGLLIYPGITDADLGADIFAKQGVLPRTWRPVVTHSGGGSWTYSVSGVTLL